MTFDSLTTISDVLAATLGTVGALIIALGAVVALVRFITGMFEKHTKDEVIARRHIDPVRVEFGRYINLGLEFIVAADILMTMFAPSWAEIGQLFVLVIIRTVISYYLLYEIKKIEERESK